MRRAAPPPPRLRLAFASGFDDVARTRRSELREARCELAAALEPRARFGNEDDLGLPDLDLALLDNITMPTLVVCGDEDRDNGSAADLAERLPDADFAEVPGTHMSSVTKPDLGQAIADWLGAQT